MTDEQLSLARRLIACEQLRWIPGMQYWSVYYGAPTGRCGGEPPPCDSIDLWVPNLADWMTAAGLLRMAMEEMWEAHCTITSGLVRPTAFDWWFDFGDGDKERNLHLDSDLGTAAARALLAIWEAP